MILKLVKNISMEHDYAKNESIIWDWNKLKNCKLFKFKLPAKNSGATVINKNKGVRFRYLISDAYRKTDISQRKPERTKKVVGGDPFNWTIKALRNVQMSFAFVYVLSHSVDQRIGFVFFLYSSRKTFTSSPFTDCGFPGRPLNGLINRTTDVGNRFAPGAVVSYSCLERHFVLKGRVQRTCQSNGMWTDYVPSCGTFYI